MTLGDLAAERVVVPAAVAASAVAEGGDRDRQRRAMPLLMSTRMTAAAAGGGEHGAARSGMRITASLRVAIPVKAGTCRSSAAAKRVAAFARSSARRPISVLGSKLISTCAHWSYWSAGSLRGAQRRTARRAASANCRA